MKINYLLDFTGEIIYKQYEITSDLHTELKLIASTLRMTSNQRTERINKKNRDKATRDVNVNDP